MSARKKLSRRDKRIFDQENTIENQTQEIIALKTKNYELEKKIEEIEMQRDQERKAYIEDLELLRDLHTIPANLQTQAG